MECQVPGRVLTHTPTHPHMTWSFQIARIFDIPVRLHLTFLLLLGWLALAGGGALLLLAVGLFTCVLLHELGHCFAARRYGVRVVDITLLPIGGLARMEIPRRSQEEFWIAAAGPAVSFALAALLFLAHRVF